MNSVDRMTEVLTGRPFTNWQLEDLNEAAEDWHVEQQQLRYSIKPYSVQYQDALFADLDARGIEYEAHPFEEVFAYINDLVPGAYHDLDDPWYFSERIEPQLGFFEHLDEEQKLYLLREPETFQIMTVEEGGLIQYIKDFLDKAVERDPVWNTVPVSDLLEYYHFRKDQIEKHANDRLTQLRGAK